MLVFSIFLLILFVSPCCAQTITSLTCSSSPDSQVHDGTNKTTFTYNCSILIDRNGQKGLDVGIYTTSTTSSKVSGNGTQTITITSPQDRFLVNGPKQNSRPDAITTASDSSNITLMANNIGKDSDANFTFDIIFEVFDADYAENTYQQHYRVRLFSKTGTLLDESPASPATNYVQYTVPEKVYISVANPPTISVDTANEVFDPAHYEESDLNVDVTVSSNNTWKLEAKIDSTPTESPNGYTIPGSQGYVACNAGASHGCWYGDGVKVQFPGAGSGSEYYVEVAKDPDQTGGNYRTGTTDNMNLDPINFTVTYYLKNSPTMIFLNGTYTATTTLNITAPR